MTIICSKIDQEKQGSDIRSFSIKISNVGGLTFDNKYYEYFTLIYSSSGITTKKSRNPNENIVEKGSERERCWDDDVMIWQHNITQTEVGVLTQIKWRADKRVRQRPPICMLALLLVFVFDKDLWDLQHFCPIFSCCLIGMLLELATGIEGSYFQDMVNVQCIICDVYHYQSIKKWCIFFQINLIIKIIFMRWWDLMQF